MQGCIASVYLRHCSQCISKYYRMSQNMAVCSQCVNGKMSAVLCKIANVRAASNLYCSRLRHTTMPFAAFYIAKHDLLHCGMWPFTTPNTVERNTIYAQKALKTRPFAPFTAIKNCTACHAASIKACLHALYVCTHFTTLFTPKRFVFQNNAK